MTVSEPARGLAERQSEMVAGFGGPIFAVRGDPVLSTKMGGGSRSGGLPSGVDVQHDAAGRGELTVETTVQEWKTQDWQLVQHLLGSDIDREALVFPTTS